MADKEAHVEAGFQRLRQCTLPREPVQLQHSLAMTLKRQNLLRAPTLDRIFLLQFMVIARRDST